MNAISQYSLQLPPMLRAQEATGHWYFSGTPLTFGELSSKLPEGAWERCLRPAMPVNGDVEARRFVPDAKRPVVCVTSLAEMAIFRALSHQSLHANLPKHDRRTGWRYDGDTPIYLAAAALLKNITALRQARIPLTSTVVAVRRDAAIFEPFDREPHQFRSYAEVPFSTANVTDVTLELWPTRVEEWEPWPPDFDLSSYAPYRPESAEYLLELCAGGTT